MVTRALFCAVLIAVEPSVVPPRSLSRHSSLVAKAVYIALNSLIDGKLFCLYSMIKAFC